MSPLERLLIDVANQADFPEVLADRARILLSAMQNRRQAAKARRTPARRERDALSRTRRDQVAQLREAVAARAGGCCEMCDGPSPTELHHLLSGGLRRKYERADSLLLLCRDCHRLVHRNEPHALSTALLLAINLGAPAEVKQSLRHRLDKAAQGKIA